MARKIRIHAVTIEAVAELNDSSTARYIWNALPLKAQANTWGDEVYFSIPVHYDLENGQELVHEGDLGFWPEGDCLCIFFGPTPISRANEIRPASAVNIVGKILGDARIFKNVSSGTTIMVTRYSPE
jgi:uncharacterized protein